MNKYRPISSIVFDLKERKNITESPNFRLAPIAVEMVHRDFYPRPIVAAVWWPFS